jgi:hypothetical protein
MKKQRTLKEEFSTALNRMNVFEAFFFYLGIFFGIGTPLMAMATFFVYYNFSFLIFGFILGASSMGYSIGLASSKLMEKTQ